MKLIKLTDEHYIIVDDSEIKEGDWYYNFDYNYIKMCVEVDREFIKNALFYEKGSTVFDYSKDCKKIIHSTEPLDGKGYWGKVMPLTLTIPEIKELIGEVDVDVEKKSEIIAKSLHDKSKHDDWSIYDQLVYEDKELIKLGYNQALEDNKEKKYTEEDLKKMWKFGYNEKNLDDSIQSLQPKTEWEVEFENGKLKLK